jgi:uncharacterized protein YjbI with pentapeptide repeats
MYGQNIIWWAIKILYECESLKRMSLNANETGFRLILKCKNPSFSSFATTLHRKSQTQGELLTPKMETSRIKGNYEFPVICWNVDCQNVDCQNVDCQNVNFKNVDCQNVDCQNVDFQNIKCQNVNCRTVYLKMRISTLFGPLQTALISGCVPRRGKVIAK